MTAISRRTRAFEAGVNGEGGVAAGGAERVAGVPVEEGACFGVDGGYSTVSMYTMCGV